jgi:DNA primase
MDTLKFPLKKAVTDHRTRLDMIAANDTRLRPGLDEQFREASAELLSDDLQAFLEPFYREQVAGVASAAEKIKTLSEAHFSFIKFARDIVQEEAFRDGVSLASISALRRCSWKFLERHLAHIHQDRLRKQFHESFSWMFESR